MSILRNVLVAACVLLIFGVWYVFVRDNNYQKMFSNQRETAVAPLPPSVKVLYDPRSMKFELDTAADKTAPADDKAAIRASLADLFETVPGQDDIPNRTVPYLMVVNNRDGFGIRHWQLSKNVRKIEVAALPAAKFDAVAQRLFQEKSVDVGKPYQATLFVPRLPDDVRIPMTFILAAPEVAPR